MKLKIFIVLTFILIYFSSCGYFKVKPVEVEDSPTPLTGVIYMVEGQSHTFITRDESVSIPESVIWILNGVTIEGESGPSLSISDTTSGIVIGENTLKAYYLIDGQTLEFSGTFTRVEASGSGGGSGGAPPPVPGEDGNDHPLTDIQKEEGSSYSDGSGLLYKLGYDVAISSSDPPVAVATSFGTSNKRGTVTAYRWDSATSNFIREPLTTPVSVSNGEWFGRSVDISENGRTIVVGAPNDEGGDGAVYVYYYSGGTWSAPVRLTLSSTPLDVEELGQCVSINENGTRIAVGFGTDSTGSKIVLFEPSSEGSWIGSVNTVMLDFGSIEDPYAPDGEYNNPVDKWFGWSLDLRTIESEDVLAIGVPSFDDNDDNSPVTRIFGDNTTGRAVIYKPSSWPNSNTTINSNYQVFVPNDITLRQEGYIRFGSSVKLSKDGKKLVISASFYNSGQAFNYNGGIIYMYNVPSSFSTTASPDPIDSFEPTPLQESAYMAYYSDSIGLSERGKILIGAASAYDLNGRNNQGKAFYLFSNQSDPSSWAYRSEYNLTSSTSTRYAYALDLSDDGRFFIAGAPESNSNRGEVFLYAAD